MISFLCYKLYGIDNEKVTCAYRASIISFILEFQAISHNCRKLSFKFGFWSRTLPFLHRTVIHRLHLDGRIWIWGRIWRVDLKGVQIGVVESTSTTQNRTQSEGQGFVFQSPILLSNQVHWICYYELKSFRQILPSKCNLIFFGNFTRYFSVLS